MAVPFVYFIHAGQFHNGVKSNFDVKSFENAEITTPFSSAHISVPSPIPRSGHSPKNATDITHATARLEQS